MTKYNRIAPEKKEQILHRIRTEGISAAQAAREHGISVHSVYNWLGRSATVPSNILQLNKLKRENDELKRLLGEAMLMSERSKKNQSNHGF
jgi:transposase-like protein